MRSRGFFGLLFFVGSLISLLFAVGLTIDHELVTSVRPSWYLPVSITLLSLALFSSLSAFVRVIRSAAILSIWGFVTVVLGSEVMFQKLPGQVTPQDIKKEIPSLSDETIAAMYNGLETISDAARVIGVNFHGSQERIRKNMPSGV